MTLSFTVHVCESPKNFYHTLRRNSFKKRRRQLDNLMSGCFPKYLKNVSFIKQFSKLYKQNHFKNTKLVSFVAVRHHRVIGFVQLCCPQNKNKTTIMNLCRKKGYKGTGAELLHQAVTYAIFTLNVTKIYLKVSINKQKLIQYYETFGWTIHKNKKNAIEMIYQTF